jgi:hypothetical protein
MMLRRACTVASVVLVFACSEDGRPPGVVGSQGGEGSDPSGGGDNGAGAAGAGSPGSGGDEGGGAASGGAGGSAEGGADDGGGFGGWPLGGATNVPIPDSICAREIAWGDGTSIDLSGGGDDEFSAITPDELTIVWHVGGTFYYADRDSDSDAFGAPGTVPAGFNQLTVSPDGLRLVGMLTADGHAGEIARASRADAFDGSIDQGPYTDINALVLTEPEPTLLADPVFSPDETRVYFTFRINIQVKQTIHESTFPWNTGNSVLGADLISEGNYRRVPTGATNDGFTLFYWDQVDDQQKVAFRAVDGGTFDYIEQLGDRRGAQPNGDCSRLYYSSDDGGDLDLMVAEPE